MVVLQPEQNLCVAILQQALEDLHSGDPEIKEEARFWLFEDEVDFPFIMGLIGLRWTKVREKLGERDV